ncbi:hypothetical protein MSG28_004315 [Choristoneura fumiferana]|uniref:Uncharacterized protein n=1 Tax=Choristoneura fumiferana TaxID=7141 RepID=A0ACC0KIZ0_CHOFU|nr:hypothetical protein MSG28_004315 [Choristoneura fumiferana]
MFGSGTSPATAAARSLRSLGSRTEEEKLDCDGRLRCETFDIEKVLRHGAHLMGSEGNEYDLDEDALNAAAFCCLCLPASLQHLQAGVIAHVEDL